MKEIELQKQIVEYLNYRKFYVWRANSGVMFIKNRNGGTRAFKSNPKGTADIIGRTPEGYFLAIEVKVEKNKPDQAQLDFLEVINVGKSIAFVAYSLDDVIKKLFTGDDA